MKNLKRFGELDEENEEGHVNHVNPRPIRPNEAEHTNKQIDAFLIKLVEERNKTNAQDVHTTAAELLIVYINTEMLDEERQEIKENI
jgi:hypothetical protein